MSIRDEINEQNKKAMAELPKGKRFQHFWHYYKIPFFVILGIIVLVAYIILKATVFAPKPYAFNVVALNSAYCLAPNAEPVDTLFENFALEEGIDTKAYQVVCDTSSSIDLHSGDTYNMAVDMRLVATGEKGDLDCIIGEGEIIDYYIPNGFYTTTIDTILSPSTYKYLEEKGYIYYYHDDSQNMDYALGVYVKDAPKIKNSKMYGEEFNPVLAVVTISDRTQTAADFIDYIFELK